MIDLKIQYTLLNNLLHSNKIDLLKEGSIFKGKIVEIKDNSVLINIPEYGLLEATLDTKSEFTIGNKILFLVKSIDNNRIYLKPLDDLQTSQSKTNTENPIVRLLTEMGIEKNEITLGLVERLMSYNLPINKDIINEAITIFEKLIGISYLLDEENITISDNRLLKDTSLLDIDTLDIRLIQFSDGELDDSLAKDISKKIKEYIRNELQLDDEESLIKITSFFIKNNIKPTLKNLKYFNELDTRPTEFFKEIQELFQLANFDNFIEIKNTTKDKMEIADGLKIITNKEENLNELKNIIIEAIKNSKKDIDEMKELESKLNFLKELSDEFSFMFFPIDYGFKDRLQGLITFIKERKRKGLGGKLNILLNLDTENLGNIRILCVLAGDFLKIKMSIRKEDLDFFRSNEEKLIEKILTIGYSVKGIDYITDEKISILDTQSPKPITSYILDLKV